VHVCIRIPQKQILLISDPISNPQVPQRDISFCETPMIERSAAVREAVCEKLSKGQHPWAVDTDSVEPIVLDVIVGATVVGLELLCRFHGVDMCKLSDLFYEPSEKFREATDKIDQEWAKELADMQKVRDARVAEIVSQQKSPLVSVTEGADGPGDTGKWSLLWSSFQCSYAP
jgi:hypothetical protein